VRAQLDANELFPIASGHGHDGAVRIHQRGAALWGGRLTDGRSGEVPDRPHAHVFVARGSARLEPDIDLSEGDAVRLTAAGARLVVANEGGAELLIWATD